MTLVAITLDEREQTLLIDMATATMGAGRLVWQSIAGKIERARASEFADECDCYRYGDGRCMVCGDESN